MICFLSNREEIMSMVTSSARLLFNRSLRVTANQEEDIQQHSSYSSQYKWHLKVNCLTKFNLRGIVSFPFTIKTVASQRAKTHLDYSSHLRSSISPLTHLTGNKFVATASSPSHISPNQIKHTGFR